MIDLDPIRAIADRVEIVGDAILIQADCAAVLPSCSAFSFHMAGLTKPNKIASFVGSFCGVKVSERDDVVNRQGIANVLSAMPAMSALFTDNLRPNSQPSLASVCRNATNVAWRFAALENAGFFKTLSATKTGGAVLFSDPRLLVKRSGAIFAFTFFALLPRMAFAARKAIGESVCGSLAKPELIASEMGFRADVESLPCPKSAGAFKRTKPRFIGAIWANEIRGCAFLASQFYCHGLTIANNCFGSIGNGTTEIAVKRITDATRQGDLFIAKTPVAKPVQEAML